MIRHLKTIVQHVFVLDDGEHLVEQVAEPITVPAKDWTAYVEPGGIFDQSMAKLNPPTG